MAKAGQLPAGYVAFCEQLLARAMRTSWSKCDGTPPPQPANPSRLRIGGTVQQAKLLKQAIPKCSQDARSRGITGTVAFRAVIGKDGLIRTLELVDATGIVRIRARRRHPLAIHRLF
jgi:hypothetical protein